MGSRTKEECWDAFVPMKREVGFPKKIQKERTDLHDGMVNDYHGEFSGSVNEVQQCP